MREDDDTVLVRCHCQSQHFLQFYADRSKPPFVYATITARPMSIRGRLRGAARSLFGRSYYETAEVALDDQAITEIADWLGEIPTELSR